MNNDLISKKAVMERIEREYKEWGEDYDIEQILGDIEDLPVACNLDADYQTGMLLNFVIQHDTEIQKAIKCKNIAKLEEILYKFFKE